MLANGVDRVIDQVVQPKIYKVFKPEIDKVMCEVLGLDSKEREENEKKRQDLLVKYQQQQSCKYKGLSRCNFLYNQGHTWPTETQTSVTKGRTQKLPKKN
jgi:hypothetical protein